MKYVGKHFETNSKTKSKQKGKHFDNNSVLESKLGFTHYFLIVIVCIVLTLSSSINNILAFFTYVDAITNVFTIIAEYTIEYDANGGTGVMADQIISFNVPTRLLQNTYTNTGFTFAGWNTEPDGSGTPYADEEQVTNLIGQNNQNVVLYAQWIALTGVAQIGTTTYSTLQAAIDDVPNNNTRTVITLLTNVTENLVVSSGQYIQFNLQNYEVTNDTIYSVLTNNGTVEIINGTLTMNAPNNGAINNNKNAILRISGGTVQMIASGGKHAIYNKGGTVEISGNAYISSVSAGFGNNERPTVENLKDGSTNGYLTITGGTIVSPNTNAVRNSSIMTIGTQGGGVSTTTPVIQGAKSGIVALANFDFYDGVIKGKTSAIDDETFVNNIETGYNIIHVQDTIGGQTYNIAYLDSGTIVTFDARGGTSSETERVVTIGSAIGTLPTATYGIHIFDGWFTDPTSGTQITTSTIINGPETFYAHWTYRYVAQVNGVGYDSLQEAIDVVPTTGVETTITLLENTSEILTVGSGQNIVFDLQNKTISNSGDNPIIANSGTIKIVNGTLSSNASQGAINNNSGGILKMTGGSIIATGTKQAIYNNGGTLEISGTAYLSATSTNRATVHNLNSGTTTITGGTIISTRFNGVENASGIVIIGTKDGTINVSSPEIRGKTNGVNNSATFKFYDGIIKGGTISINGNITEIETNSSRVNTTEVIGGVTYQVTYLSITP